MSLGKTKKTLLAALAGLAVCLSCPTPGYADHDDWHHDHDGGHVGIAIGIPGLAIGLGDNDFSEHWNRSDYNARASFCHDVRHDCYMEGRYSRACHLKWQYCTPDGRDYGYYYNH